MVRFVARGGSVTVPALWTKHRRIASAIAATYFIPGADRQDVEQEALIALWEACRSYDPDRGPFQPYAATVIRRRLVDAVKSATRHKALVLTTSARDRDLPHLHQVTDRCETNEEIRQVLEAITRLTAWERHCVIGTASGLTYAEIGGPAKRVDNTLHRARRKLRAAA